ncbi:MAG: thioredoxin family protein [Candidatus Methanofastidiosa archaeon]|nr:thioredoxin family protein [Candidatus Methanofastidiosa archaeon]
MLKIYHFYADWAEDSDVQNNILEELIREYEDITVELVNVDYQEAMAKKYEIVTVPTLVMELDKEVVSKIEGLVELEDLEDLIDEIFSEEYGEEEFWDTSSDV